MKASQEKAFRVFTERFDTTMVDGGMGWGALLEMLPPRRARLETEPYSLGRGPDIVGRTPRPRRTPYSY